MYYNDKPVDAYQEHCDFNYSTDTEWDNAEANELSQMNPNQAWVLTDRDVWHQNPHYRGDPVPHPEYEFNSDEEYDDWVANEKARLAGNKVINNYFDKYFDNDFVPF